MLKIAPTGELVYATYLGGSSASSKGALAVDAPGSAVVCGSTAHPNLHSTGGAFQANLDLNLDVFDCSRLQLDGEGNVYLYGNTDLRFFPTTPGAYRTPRSAGVNLLAAMPPPPGAFLILLFFCAYLCVLGVCLEPPLEFQPLPEPLNERWSHGVPTSRVVASHRKYYAEATPPTVSRSAPTKGIGTALSVAFG